MPKALASTGSPSLPTLAASTLALAVALTTLGTAGTAHAVPLYRAFGGPAGFGTGILNRNDDNSTGAIDLTGAFSGGLRFYGGPYTQFWVNNNGNITFNGPIGTYTPRMFPIATQPMIAPYWGDVDTRNAAGLADPSENLVYYHLEPGRLVVTWFDVGYYANHNEHRMSFQLIVTNATDCGSGDFDVEFRYDRCEWVAGGASGDTNGDGQCSAGEAGCVPAQAGFDAGNLTDFVALPGSFTPLIANVCTTSNIGEPGIWQFSVRAGGVVCREDAVCTIPGETGPCSLGRTQCVGGVAMCQAITTPVDEICDAVDNDCNGMPDDAPALCGTGLTCSLGQCVPPCFEGACDADYTCDAVLGICVETACIDVTCAEDERCEGGVCIDACSGIVCPHGQVCISGACVDPCSAVVCDADRICRNGICVLRCPCSPCPVGDTCLADGTCLARGCDVVLCDEGRYCEDSTCHDACEGVVCPRGQFCYFGECVLPGRIDAGPPPVPDAGPLEPDAGTFDAGTFDAYVEPDAYRGPPMRPTDGNCGCRTAAEPAAPSIAWSALIGLGIVVARRSRR